MKVAVIAGPTASGKTALSIALAQRLGGEIVSADSMQIYRRMDIGTAKAEPEQRAAVPHHMLDVAEPWEDYSVARYVEQADACCRDILSRGRLPIITGGTGLYIDSLISGRSFACRSEGDEDLRRRLDGEYQDLGGEAMLSRLREFDPERAARLHPADRRRIVRAMEIYLLTGVTATEHDRQTRAIPPRYEARRIVLGYEDRAALYERIDLRVEEMVCSGLFEEVDSLLKEGVPPGCTAMQAIGYKESAEYLEGLCSREQAIAAVKQNSRRYAKRQLTWFSRWTGALRISWKTGPEPERALAEAEAFI